MDYNLIVIGAHKGEKIEKLVREASSGGDVLLFEPINEHCKILTERFKNLSNVRVTEAAISTTTGQAQFHYIPEASTEGLPHWATELGSFNAQHAAGHIPQASDRIRAITVETIAVEDMLSRFSVGSVRHLSIDTEGHDYHILRCFPFWKIKPSFITFEHKHMDGTDIVGPKFAEILVRLNGYGYGCRVASYENTIAFLR